jgi:cell wall-associated NlpC family hydrolase
VPAPTNADALRRELKRERKAGRDGANRLRHMLRRERTEVRRQRRVIRRERALGVGVRFARIALGQRGTPYVWGGAAPGGFDCSGLVKWSARKLGRDLPRTTGGLIHAGQPVSTRARSRWRIGDLLFAHPGHVAIYVGGGHVVNAPHSGAVVRIQAARPPIAVRRVV